MIPKRKAISFAVVNLVHCRLTPTQPFSEKGCLPRDCLLLTKFLLNNYNFFRFLGINEKKFKIPSILFNPPIDMFSL
ncbi:MAG: hypothetical protein LBK82_00675 [Planctomycetaceae bacterium]|nr:hypothetical protein [Planctomycetaceae bacterium]